MELVSAMAQLVALALILVGLVWLIVVMFRDNVGWLSFHCGSFP